ncbi:MAG: PDGLE domain-containing protein [Thermoanaerobacteraceae bacterium]|nr:PDGLE domain-containing protein [Thermoanaerobacteraceae bacterium]
MRRFYLLLIILALIIITPLSSALPDGLERVAGDLGFLNREREIINAVFSGYTIPWFSGPISSIISAVIGALAVYLLILIMFREKKG